eukprot:6201909-Pleurochrysis_carterae.AAC.2
MQYTCAHVQQRAHISLACGVVSAHSARSCAGLAQGLGVTLLLCAHRLCCIERAVKINFLKVLLLGDMRASVACEDYSMSMWNVLLVFTCTS